MLFDRLHCVRAFSPVHGRSLGCVSGYVRAVCRWVIDSRDDYTAERLAHLDDAYKLYRCKVRTRLVWGELPSHKTYTCNACTCEPGVNKNNVISM